MTIEFILNSRQQAIQVPPEKRMIDMLREDFGLKGVKEGCGEGECGACAILLDGKVVASCILPAIMAHGRNIETIEGIRSKPVFPLIEEAFKSAGAVQCGFCTPGMVVATVSLLQNNPNPSEKDIREAISGNLCRCTGYHMILEGIRIAVQKWEAS